MSNISKLIVLIFFLGVLGTVGLGVISGLQQPAPVRAERLQVPLQQGCTTYSSHDTPLTIPDANTQGITSTIILPPIGYAQSFSVVMNVTHSYPGDLSAFVQRSNTCYSQIFSDVLGNDGITSQDLSFADSGVHPITDADYPYGDVYQPDSPFVAGGSSTGGRWQLHMIDDAGGDEGTLNSWSVTVCNGSTRPTPTPTLSLAECVGQKTNMFIGENTSVYGGSWVTPQASWSTTLDLDCSSSPTGFHFNSLEVYPKCGWKINVDSAMQNHWHMNYYWVPRTPPPKVLGVNRINGYYYADKYYYAGSGGPPSYNPTPVRAIATTGPCTGYEPVYQLCASEEGTDDWSTSFADLGDLQMKSYGDVGDITYALCSRPDLGPGSLRMSMSVDITACYPNPSLSESECNGIPPMVCGTPQPRSSWMIY